MGTTLRYNPPVTDHPGQGPTPNFSEGDVVKIIRYNGTKSIRKNGEYIGSEKYLTDDADDYTTTSYIVKEIDGYRVKVQFGLTDTIKWIPRDMVVGVDEQRKEELERRKEKRERQARLIEKRKEQDLGFVMDTVIKPHARKVVNDVWPGGTVDVDEISWFWNNQLYRCAARAYKGSAVPESMADGNLAIGLSPDYYYKHGITEILEIVRHELIHIWQFEHPDCQKSGHGPKFKQWLDDINACRHCKHF